MQQTEFEFRENLFGEAFEFFDGGFELEFRFFDDRIDDVALMACGDFAAQKLPHSGQVASARGYAVLAWR